MKSAAYWRNRSALLMYDRMEGAEKISAEIAELYKAAYEEVSHSMGGIFAAYEKAYGLSEQDAMELLDTLIDPADFKALTQKLATLDTEEAKQLRAMLNAPEVRRKLTRFQELQAQIEDINKRLYGQDLSAQRQWYTSLGYDTYYKTIFNVQREVGLNFTFAHIDDKLIRAVMNSSWAGATFSQRLWSNTEGLTQEVRKQLTLGLITGKTERRMAKEIAERYAVGAFQSRRLIRTESCYLSNEIQFRAYEACGADRYQYVATLDSRTDEECGALDRQIFNVKDKKPGVNCPPMHPFCRCTTKIYIDQDTRDDMKRRAKDPVTGKYAIVSANLSYTEWAKQNGIAPKK